MLRYFKLGAVAAIVLANTACFEITSSVKVAADGKTDLVVSTLIQQKLITILQKMGSSKGDLETKFTEQMPTELKPEDAAALTAAGGKVNKLTSSRDDAGLHWDVDLSFDQLSGLSKVTSGALESTVPEILVEDLGAGTYKMTFHAAKGPADPTAAPADATPKAKEKKKSKKEQAADMEALGELMGTMIDMRISFAVDVPGEILSVTPAEGKFSGGHAAWTFDGASIQAQMADQQAAFSAPILGEATAPDGAPAPDAAATPGSEIGAGEQWSVTFKMPAGTSLPASLITPAG